MDTPPAPHPCACGAYDLSGCLRSARFVSQQPSVRAILPASWLTILPLVALFRRCPERTQRGHTERRNFCTYQLHCTCTSPHLSDRNQNCKVCLARWSKYSVFQTMTPVAMLLAFGGGLSVGSLHGKRDHLCVTAAGTPCISIA